MNNEEKHIDKQTSEWLKKLELEEPSESFSRNVMQSVFALQKKSSEDNFNYWWYLGLLPVLIAGGWFLSQLSFFEGKFSTFLNSVQSYYHLTNTAFGDFFLRIKSMSISPVVILLFLAVLSLLVIEDIFSTSRHRLKVE